MENDVKKRFENLENLVHNQGEEIKVLRGQLYDLLEAKKNEAAQAEYHEAVKKTAQVA
jgi:hypothetical protein